MSRLDRMVLTAGALALGLSLSACGSSSDFDPQDLIPTNLFGLGKKPLPGERRAVFPEGVPGVPQGVPPELYKGHQAAAEQNAATADPAPPKPAAKPASKPKAKPRTASTAQPRPARASSQTQPADAQRPDPNADAQQNAWPPPNPNTFSR